MSRVIPVNTPSWDYSLWESVKFDAAQMPQVEIDNIAARDNWDSSRKSPYWDNSGRVQNGDTVIDFITLSRNFDNLDQIPNLADSIMEELQRKSKGLIGGDLLQFENSEDWLQVNWPILSKVVGAAVASVGKTEGFWSNASGKDAKISHNFWIDMKEQSKRNPLGEFVDDDNWQDLIKIYRDKKLDPSSAVLRGQSHPPTSPIIRRGSKYYRNPIAVEYRKKMRVINRESGNQAKEFAEYHGTLTFKVIREAMGKLSRGKISDFLWEIHGICAGHILREEALIQHKIGLHLVSNLATRKSSRGVGGIPVPDLAHAIDTGFSFGSVLKILHDAGLIDWYTVDAERVTEAIAEIKSR